MREMESLCLRHSIPLYLHANPISSFPPTTRRFGASFRPAISARKSDFQDFQGYAKPIKLLPAAEAKVCSTVPSEEIIKSIEDVESQSLYKIVLKTSPIYGSELTDMASGVLVCIIDANGNSILERIPASSDQDHLPESGADSCSGVLHFQRNSVDEFVFQGPKLGNIEAIWISVESGRWRLGGISLTVINHTRHQPEESMGSNDRYASVRYDFEAEDIFLGEGGDISMVELRPYKITKYNSTDNPLTPTDDLSPTFSGDMTITKEESMREYSNLKFSLLLYDTILTLSGTSIASLTTGESSALAFLTGGIVGFLYLLLLQRSVDEIPAPGTISSGEEDGMSRLVKGVKGPVLVLAMGTGLGVLVAKGGSIGVDLVLSPKEIVVGMAGFLVCKAAVLLAAFRPVSMRLKDTD